MIDQGKAIAADLGFIVDRSAALSSNEIKSQYLFIRALALRYVISVQWSHFSVITAAESAETVIQFGDFFNYLGFASAMDKLSTSAGGELRIDLALAAAVNQMFTTSAGMRSGKAR